ncbi:hypothetical protein J6590_095312 [Homalodisca vitripennis]|nr:hypothetical protein J6590_095312 [Homalodisca vitripennis]
MLDETDIDEVYSTKFLGIHLDRGLTWDFPVDSVCSKLSPGIYVLKQLSKYCPARVLITVHFGSNLPKPLLRIGFVGRLHQQQRLPNSIKSLNMPKAFKVRLKSSLIHAEFYDRVEFLTHDWENAELAD